MRSRTRRAGHSLPVIFLALAGLWLLLAPLLLRFSGERAATINHLIAGLLLLALTPHRLQPAAATLPQWTRWLPVALGLWLLVSPWVFATTDLPAVRRDDLVTGGVVLTCSIWNLAGRARPRFHEK